MQYSLVKAKNTILEIDKIHCYHQDILSLHLTLTPFLLVQKVFFALNPACTCSLCTDTWTQQGGVKDEETPLCTTSYSTIFDPNFSQRKSILINVVNQMCSRSEFYCSLRQRCHLLNE